MGLFGRGGGGFFGGGPSGFISEIIRDSMREEIKKSDTIVGDFFRTVDDAKDEFHELCTDGFVEMVIKGNSDYKTSFEIKQEADEKIGKARRIYHDRCCDFNKYLDTMNNRINAMYNKKMEIAKLLNQVVSSMPNMPKISGFMDSPSYSYKPSTISVLCEYSGLGKISDIKGRKESANVYLEDAKDFEVEISRKIAEINKTEAFLNTIKMNLDEEEMLLNALNDSISMKRNMAYEKVAAQLHILISEYILDPDGTENEKYIAAINQLKRIS